VSALFLSILQWVVAVILSAIAAYLAVYLFQWLTYGLDEWEELRQGNPAVGVVVGATLVAVAIMLRPALSITTTSWDIGSQGIVWRSLLALGLQLAVGLVLAVVSIGCAVYLFALLTRGLDEVQQLAQGNIAVAVLLAGVVLGVALLTSSGISQILTLITQGLF
jgi:uncharacterized membrane protein YjfL (UPF0719 family)